MKKLINRPEDAVREELAGVAAAHGDRLRVHLDPHYIVRGDAPVRGKVAVVSGGGSGHEPMHGGFVGPGMLDAACPGEVFTSPTPDQVMEATVAVSGGAGVLHIVKNYTGDVMNFEMAAELAGDEGIAVEQVVIDDDVAVSDSLYTAGRRGVGATVLAEKLCGAAAQQGRPLAEVTEICRRVNANARSMGAALTSCTVPAVGKPTFDLGDDEMEIGVGIHGEPGRERLPLASAHDVVEILATSVVKDLPFSRGDQVLAFVNGLGGTPLMELYIVYNELSRATGWARHRHRPQPRGLVHHVSGHGRLLDHAAPSGRRAHGALGRAGGHRRPAVGGLSVEAVERDAAAGRAEAALVTSRGVAAWMRAFAAAMAREREHLTELDAAIGDADHGTNMDRGMQAVLARLGGSSGAGEPSAAGAAGEPAAPEAAGRPRVDDAPDLATLLKTIGMALVSSVGGAAGPLYGTLFLQMGKAAAAQEAAAGAAAGAAGAAAADSEPGLSLVQWAAVLQAGVAGVQARGKAGLGDKTMIDALAPAADALSAAAADGLPPAEALRRSAEAAEAGMAATIPMVARKGRASYLGERSAGHQDPGATSSWLLLDAAARALM